MLGILFWRLGQSIPLLAGTMGRIRCVPYNPMSLRQADRLHEISAEFANIHMVALQGTCIRAKGTSAVGYTGRYVEEAEKH